MHATVSSPGFLGYFDRQPLRRLGCRPLHAFAASAALQAFRQGLPWCLLGLTLGISFVAQPGKFLAEQVALPQLLSVGSTLFHISHGVQLVLLLACLGMAWRTPRARTVLAVAAAALAVLAVQHLLLLPALDARVHLYLKGMAPGPSHHHLAYVALELGKVTQLVALALASGRPATAERDNNAWSHP